MSDKAFRDFMARINQIGQVARIYNPLTEPMRCQVEIGGEGGAVIITIPPGGELRFIVSAYDMQCKMETPTPAQTLSDGDQPNR
jgi:hypothetical protein